MAYWNWFPWNINHCFKVIYWQWFNYLTYFTALILVNAKSYLSHCIRKITCIQNLLFSDISFIRIIKIKKNICSLLHDLNRLVVFYTQKGVNFHPISILFVLNIMLFHLSVFGEAWQEEQLPLVSYHCVEASDFQCPTLQ